MDKLLEEKRQGEVLNTKKVIKNDKKLYIESFGCAMNFSDSEIVASILSKKGYKIVNLSYEGFVGTNIINKQKLSWEKTFNYLHHADLFIGLGSGLSWVNWALNKKTVMINNFIPLGFEFTKKLTKIENTSGS